MVKRLNLIGHVYGRLTVVKEVAQIKTKRSFLCECECGKSVIALMDSLRSGNTKSCGCLRDDVTSETKLIDLTGQRFGKLVVTGRAPNNEGNRNPRWFCMCDCGKQAEVFGLNLKNGMTKTCGCGRPPAKPKPPKRVKRFATRREYESYYYFNVKKPRRIAERKANKAKEQ